MIGAFDRSGRTNLGHALAAAVREHPRAKRRILVLTHDQLPARSEAGVEVRPAHQWLLDGEAPV